MQPKVSEPLPVPAGAGELYTAGWERGDSFARSGGDLHADGPLQASDEEWIGFVDALAEHRRASAGATEATVHFELKPGTQIRNRDGTGSRIRTGFIVTLAPDT